MRHEKMPPEVSDGDALLARYRQVFNPVRSALVTKPEAQPSDARSQ
jgi:hypothetical protein